MKLVRSEDVRLRLGLPNVDTIVAAADNAAEEATLHLINDLRTPLLQADYSDVWLIHQVDWNRPFLKLKLTAGFVADGWQFGTGTTVADAQADTSLTSQIVFDAEKGVAMLCGLEFWQVCLGKFVSARYTAGYPAAASPNTDNVFDLTVVPDWLQKMGELKSIALMAQSPEFANKDGTVIDGQSFDRQYQMLLEDRVRFTPDCRLPL